MYIVDGGYLSWRFGSDPRYRQHWDYRQYRNVLIVWDSETSLRKQLVPTYKANRPKQEARDAAQARRREATKLFKAEVNEIKGMHTYEVAGLEADDVIACFASIGEPIVVVGQDKDLLQLDGVMVVRSDGSEVQRSDWLIRVPKRVRDVVAARLERDPLTIVLALALLGDAADNIPRLVPARRLDEFVDVLRAPCPWRAAAERYGPAFSQNVSLTLLPYPRWLGIDESDALARVRSGAWRREEIWSLVPGNIKEEIITWRALLSTPPADRRPFWLPLPPDVRPGRGGSASLSQA